MPELRQRQPRITDKAFLAFVRQQRCCVCSAPPPVQAAHIRYSDAAHGHINPGMGGRSNDSESLPLCAKCHLDDRDAQHKGSERRFWERAGIDPFVLAANLYNRFKSEKSNG